MAEDKSKEAAKATLIRLVKPEAKKEKTAMAVKVSAEVQKTETVKEVAKVKTEMPKQVRAEAKPEAKAETKPEAKKEADPSKEFVDGIMAEMSLKGGSKKRLIKMLAEQYNFDKQKVLFKLKRALITERYAAEHAAAEGAGGAGH